MKHTPAMHILVITLPYAAIITSRVEPVMEYALWLTIYV